MALSEGEAVSMIKNAIPSATWYHAGDFGINLKETRRQARASRQLTSVSRIITTIPNLYVLQMRHGTGCIWPCHAVVHNNQTLRKPARLGELVSQALKRGALLNGEIAYIHYDFKCSVLQLVLLCIRTTRSSRSNEQSCLPVLSRRVLRKAF